MIASATLMSIGRARNEGRDMTARTASPLFFRPRSRARRMRFHPASGFRAPKLTPSGADRGRRSALTRARAVDRCGFSTRRPFPSLASTDARRPARAAASPAVAL
eukprot:30784-Pelagococcus_subviridis.AAC.2